MMTLSPRAGPGLTVAEKILSRHAGRPVRADHGLPTPQVITLADLVRPDGGDPGHGH